MPATLEASELYLSYGDGYILDGLNIEITSNTPPVGLIGASGVGKTTLMATLAGAFKPPRGTVTLDGRPVARLILKAKQDFKARVRLVSQYSMSISDPRTTAALQITKALRQARRVGRSHATPVEEILTAVGLGPQHANRPTVTLSGGERQRVALAVALATRPEILLLDEPLTGLDPHSKAALARHLKGLIEQLGMGALVASHDVDLIRSLCPSVHAMAEGKLIASGPLDEVLVNAPHPDIRDMASALPEATARFR